MRRLRAEVWRKNLTDNNKKQGIEDYQNVMIFDHPLIVHKITMLRSKDTTTKEFRELTREISTLMAYEVTRDLPLETIEVETPMRKTTARVIAGKKLAFVPILRAGLGMADGMLDLVPMAKVGHIGLYRDPETLEPVDYYFKLPADSDKRDIILLDPMLATGGSASAAISFLKARGYNNIRFVCLIAAPEGVERLHTDHPDVSVFCASLDEKLDENGYILPGLGDAGDRLFGTK